LAGAIARRVFQKRRGRDDAAITALRESRLAQSRRHDDLHYVL
jgi:hypothetical protein